MRRLMTSVLVLSIAAPSAAQDALTSPYRDQTAAEIRGLTEKEISELREGRGMGLARAAELNGYPGPRHVLDAVREGRLRLSPGQLQTVQRLFDERLAATDQLIAAKKTFADAQATLTAQQKQGAARVRNDVVRDTWTDAEWTTAVRLKQKLFARDGDRLSRRKP